MTEEEAKQHWCPFGRASTQNSKTAANIGIDARTAERFCITLCIGSQCMAWRGADAYKPTGDRDGSQGYCGLAGKP